MKATNFLASGVVGGIVNLMTGWVFYTQLFPEIYPKEENMVFIVIGCIVYGLFMAYTFTGLGSITETKAGLKAGAIFGLFYGLTMNLFMYATQEPNYQIIGMDVGVHIVSGAITGLVIALINGKMK